MKTKHFKRARLTLVVGALFLAGSLSALPAAAEPHQERPADSMQGHQDWLKHKIDQTAERLEIKASQQNAWQAYAKSVAAIGTGIHAEPDDTADAATIAKFHAERAGQFAAKLKQIAEATAKLEAVLTAEQRKTFDQIVREAMHHGPGHHEHEEMMHGHDGMGHGEREHCEHHEGGEPPPAPGP
jgi:Spy/CpxP family protein refolding chaperone